MPQTVTAVGTAPTTTLEDARAAIATQQGPAQEMDREVFLKLLVTQLQNQDPSSPMDTNEMVSQAAQLSMTETLNTISETLQVQSAASGMSTAATLIGRTVDWIGEDGAGTGTVTGAVFRDGQTRLEIDHQRMISTDQVTGLSSASPDPTRP